MIFEVKDNGWGDGITFVEVSDEKIVWGDYYLYINKKGKPISIELCDSKDLACWVNKEPKKYKKIIKASKEVHRGLCLWNENVIIDIELVKK